MQRKSLILRNMDAPVRQSGVQVGTISDEKWNSLHTVEELDIALKTIIHNRFEV